jgi:hypothetical protein
MYPTGTTKSPYVKKTLKLWTYEVLEIVNKKSNNLGHHIEFEYTVTNASDMDQCRISPNACEKSMLNIFHRETERSSTEGDSKGKPWGGL